MKKGIKIALLLIVLGGAGYFGYQLYTSKQVKATASKTSYMQTVIARGNISNDVTGTGALSIGQTQDVALDYAVTVTETLVQTGEMVTAGQALMNVDTVALQSTINTLQEELDTCESDMASISNAYSSTTTIKMPLYGRVKEVYIEAGQYVQDVMAEKGSIALLSLDGWMAVEIDTQEGMAIGDTVGVTVGRTKLDGTVRAIADGKATVTFSDAYSSEGGEVTVSYGDQTLGTYMAHIHMPYQLTVTEQGYLSAVYLEVNKRMWTNNRVAALINVPVSDEYVTLENTREKLQANIAQAKAMLASGTVDSPIDGIVSSVLTASATEQAASTALATLYVGDQKQMIVSVDELDIINVQVGQDVEIAMDAITGQTYSASVKHISQLGTSESGVTVYDVTLAIDGDDRLKIGMNGTATIKIEQVEDVLLVPISALNTSRDGQYVWLYDENLAQDGTEPGIKTSVTTGMSDENYAEVVSGLEEGDTVLIVREAATGTGSDRSEMGGMMMDMGGTGMTMPVGEPPSGGGPGGGRPGI